MPINFLVVSGRGGKVVSEYHAIQFLGWSIRIRLAWFHWFESPEFLIDELFVWPEVLSELLRPLRKLGVLVGWHCPRQIQSTVVTTSVRLGVRVGFALSVTATSRWVNLSFVLYLAALQVIVPGASTRTYGNEDVPSGWSLCDEAEKLSALVPKDTPRDSEQNSVENTSRCFLFQVAVWWVQIRVLLSPLPSSSVYFYRLTVPAVAPFMSARSHAIWKHADGDSDHHVFELG